MKDSVPDDKDFRNLRGLYGIPPTMALGFILIPVEAKLNLQQFDFKKIDQVTTAKEGVA